MPGCGFAKFNIELGKNVQFGKECKVAYNVSIADDVLMACKRPNSGQGMVLRN